MPLCSGCRVRKFLDQSQNESCRLMSPPASGMCGLRGTDFGETGLLRQSDMNAALRCRPISSSFGGQTAHALSWYSACTATQFGRRDRELRGCSGGVYWRRQGVVDEVQSPAGSDFAGAPADSATPPASRQTKMAHRIIPLLAPPIEIVHGERFLVPRRIRHLEIATAPN